MKGKIHGIVHDLKQPIGGEGGIICITFLLRANLVKLPSSVKAAVETWCAVTWNKIGMGILRCGLESMKQTRYKYANNMLLQQTNKQTNKKKKKKKKKTTNRAHASDETGGVEEVTENQQNESRWEQRPQLHKNVVS